MIENLIQDMIDSMIKEVLSAPGYQSVSEAERQKIESRLNEHLQNLVLDTLLNRLDKEQSRELSQLVESGSEEDLESKISVLSAKVPNLAQDIEERLKQEVELLKKLQ